MNRKDAQEWPGTHPLAAQHLPVGTQASPVCWRPHVCHCHGQSPSWRPPCGAGALTRRGRLIYTEDTRVPTADASFSLRPQNHCHCLCKGPSHKCESPEWRRLNPVLLSSPPPPGPRTASSPSQDTSTPTPTSWESGFVPPSPEPGAVHPSPGFALQSGDFWAAVPG